MKVAKIAAAETIVEIGAVVRIVAAKAGEASAVTAEVMAAEAVETANQDFA